MHNFDRGLIKWLPFDALSGFKDAINKLKNKRLKIEKPILSDDQYERLNIKIKIAEKYKKEIEIYYYQNGEIKYLSGLLNKVDLVYKVVIIGRTKISAFDIIEIIFNDDDVKYQEYDFVHV